MRVHILSRTVLVNQKLDRATLRAPVAQMLNPEGAATSTRNTEVANTASTNTVRTSTSIAASDTARARAMARRASLLLPKLRASSHKYDLSTCVVNLAMSSKCGLSCRLQI